MTYAEILREQLGIKRSTQTHALPPKLAAAMGEDTISFMPPFPMAKLSQLVLPELPFPVTPFRWGGYKLGYVTGGVDVPDWVACTFPPDWKAVAGKPEQGTVHTVPRCSDPTSFANRTATPKALRLGKGYLKASLTEPEVSIVQAAIMLAVHWRSGQREVPTHPVYNKWGNMSYTSAVPHLEMGGDSVSVKVCEAVFGAEWEKDAELGMVRTWAPHSSWVDLALFCYYQVATNNEPTREIFNAWMKAIPRAKPHLESILQWSGTL